jgi:hypothetical protein
LENIAAIANEDQKIGKIWFNVYFNLSICFFFRCGNSTKSSSYAMCNNC